MKDQNSIVDDENKKNKWNRGLDLFTESVLNLIMIYVSVLTIKSVFMS